MKLTSSFRGRLAVRFGLMAMLLTVASSGLAYIALRHSLYGRLDAVLRRVAEIEAAATADSPDGTVHFHDALFHSPSSEGGPFLTRYAEVWTLDGEPVVRTDNLDGRDLPLPESVRERVVATGEPELFAVRWNEGEYRAFLYPLVLVGAQHRPYLLQVVASTQETQEVLHSVLRLLAALVLVGMVGGGAGGWWLAGYAVRPVMEIIRQAEAFEIEREDHRISAHSDTEELTRLVAVLNSMLARIDETLDIQRRFLADAGHSIKTPLTILRGDIDVALRRRRSAEEYEKVLEQALTDLKDVSTLAEDLITLARSDGGALVPTFRRVAVADLLSGVGEKFAPTARRADVQLAVDVDRQLTVMGDPALLERAVSNLLDNAIKYGAEGGEVLLSSSVADDGWAHISVSDRGSGISEQQLQRLFDRFNRGGQSSRQVRGFGLGLPIAKAIIESHHGKIEISSEPGKGTRVTLRLQLHA